MLNILQTFFTGQTHPHISQDVETQPSARTLSQFIPASPATSTMQFNKVSGAIPPSFTNVSDVVPQMPFISSAENLTLNPSINSSQSETTPRFSHTKKRKRDPILDLTEDFKKDQRAKKINLGVGVYKDEEGKSPSMQCVIEAKKKIGFENPDDYIPMGGLPEYVNAVQELVFGENSEVVADGRAITVQSLGGSGALKTGADFLKSYYPNSKVWVSDPTWENHRGIFEGAGFEVNSYPYYDEKTHGVNFDRMLAQLNELPANSIVLLHACCHNPTGADLTSEQWAQVIEVVKHRNLIPFLDMAYQGFANGLEKDGQVVHDFINAGVDVFIATSFSKSFGLYGERVGALSYVAANADEGERVLSQFKGVVRTTISSASANGARIVATAWSDKDLRALWVRELGARCARINAMRELFVKKLAERMPNRDFSFIKDQRGMFSYLGLSEAQMIRLREEHAIYALLSGRICMAALNEKNIDTVVNAIYRVLSTPHGVSKL